MPDVRSSGCPSPPQLTSLPERGAPIGSLMPMFVPSPANALPNRLPLGAQEWLRTGVLVSYDATRYQQAVQAAPILGRYGFAQDVAVTVDATDRPTRMVYDPTNGRMYLYVWDASTSWRSYYTSDPFALGWTTGPTFGATNAPPNNTFTARANGGGVAVLATAALNDVRIYTATGTGVYSARTAATISGQCSRNVGFDGTNWLWLNSVAANMDTANRRLGQQNPDGAWTTAATTNPPSSDCQLDGNGTTWVALDGSNVRSSADNGATWTTRSLAVMTGFARVSNLSGCELAWTGTEFIIPARNTTTGAVRFQRSTDGVTWTLDSADVRGLTVPTPTTGQFWWNLASDRAGRVWLQTYESQLVGPSAANANTYGLYYSTDGGRSFVALPWAAGITVQQHGALAAAGGLFYTSAPPRSTASVIVATARVADLGVTPQMVGLPDALQYMVSYPQVSGGFSGAAATVAPMYVRTR